MLNFCPKINNVQQKNKTRSGSNCLRTSGFLGELSHNSRRVGAFGWAARTVGEAVGHGENKHLYNRYAWYKRGADLLAH